MREERGGGRPPFEPSLPIAGACPSSLLPPPFPLAQTYRTSLTMVSGARAEGSRHKKETGGAKKNKTTTPGRPLHTRSRARARCVCVARGSGACGGGVCAGRGAPRSLLLSPFFFCSVGSARCHSCFFFVAPPAARVSFSPPSRNSTPTMRPPPPPGEWRERRGKGDQRTADAPNGGVEHADHVPLSPPLPPRAARPPHPATHAHDACQRTG